MAEILVVDDDVRIRELLTKTLQSQGHVITTAANGLEALGIIHAHQFDLAILDLVLPQVDGLGLLSIIRQRRPQTMVVMVSSQANSNAVSQALKLGAYDFLKKPFQTQELLNVANAALNEARRMKEAGYVFKDNRCNDESLVRTGVIYGLSDSVLAGLTFYVGFLLQGYLFSQIGLSFFVGAAELWLMSLGLAFCYGFVFVSQRGYRTDLIDTPRAIAGHLWRNISYAYLLNLAMLFLAKDTSFAASRPAIGIGYLLGLTGLLANRLALLPAMLTRFKREGKRNIIIVGAGKSTASERVVSESDSKIRVLGSPAEARALHIGNEVEEVHLSADRFSAPEILSVMDNFHGRQLKVVVHGHSERNSRDDGLSAS